MKIIYSFLLVLLSASANAQWVIQTSPVAAELRGVFFTAPDTGYIVGAQVLAGGVHTILKTTDGGTTWNQITTPWTDTLRAVYFTDDTTGYASGANGRIFKTYDAGATWDTLTTGVTNLLRTIVFPTQDTGYAAGGGGVIIKTTDAGATWVQQVSGTTQDLINMRFVNADTGYACSSLSTFLSGLVIKTTDGGNTWTTVYTHTEGLLGIAVIDANTVVAGGGNQTIVRTADGGITWDTVYTGTAGTNLRASAFTTPSIGYMVGDAGSLFSTNDGGITWTNTAVTTAGILGIHFPNADTGYAVGTVGTILKYTSPCTPVLPSPGPMTGDSVVCGLDTVTYYVNSLAGATSYLWTVPAFATLISGQGDTLITVVFANGASGPVSCQGINVCGPGSAATIPVTVNTSPSPPTITPNGLSLQSSVPSGNQWNFNGVPIPGATGVLYTPTQNGTYTLTYTNAAGCSATSAPYQVTNVGAEEFISEQQLLLFPNPANQSLTLTLSKGKAIVYGTLKIFDVTGRVMWNSEVRGQKSEIDVSKFEAGVYAIKLNLSEGKTLSSKLTIVR